MKRFSKSVLLTILVITMAFALVGCKTAEVAAEPEVVEVATPEAPAAETPAAEAPAAEAPAAEAPAAETPAAEAPAAEEAVAEEPALQPIVQYYSLLGYEVKVVADVGRAEIYYPSIVTYEDGLALLAYAKENYGAYLEGVTYELHDGYVVLNYPETWGVAELQTASQAVQAYVASVLGEQMQPVAVAEEPAAAPAAEAAAAEGKIVKEISLYGYTATIEYADKVATITYPSFITNDEVIAAAQAAYAAYSAYLQDTTLAVDNGTATMTFPAEVSEADLDFVIATLQAELPAYVASILSSVPAAEAPAAETAVAEAQAEPIVRTIDILGYQATIEYADKVATITYPSFITNAEIAQAAKAAYASFGKYLEGTELSINSGKAVLTFPADITEADVDYAVALLSAQLPAYVATLFPAEEPAAEPVAEEPAEVAVVAEAPAAEAPAAEPAAETTAPAAAAPAATTTTTTTTTPAATSTTTTTTTPAASAASTAATAATEVAKKKTNGGLIAAIVVLCVAACAAVVILLKKKKK